MLIKSNLVNNPGERQGGLSVDAPVEIIEEGNEVETKLDEALLFVTRKSSEDFCSVVHVVLAHNPMSYLVSISCFCSHKRDAIGKGNEDMRTC